MVLKRIKEMLTRRPGRSRSLASEAASPAENAEASYRPTPEAPPIHRGPEVVHHPVALQDLDSDAVRIVKRLTRFDHTAYLVGGCVRDLLLARSPKDFDIGTSATPRQIKRLFSNCRIIGRRFRLAHIYFQNGKIIEVATFRARDVVEAGGPEGAAPAASDEAEDLLIRDDNVFGTPEQDALRRDFTINALFYDPNAETVIDHVDGMGDLRRRLVRTIGDPAVRFREDPIRILRALKFAARLSFDIEEKTLVALRQTRGEIPKAAAPRILEEINRFCRGGAARRSFELAIETGVFAVILPELAETYPEGSAARRSLLALLDAIDTRLKGDRDIATGEIFSALLFGAVAPTLGWPLTPEAGAGSGGRDARTVVDEALRPIALRLRLARRDQERVRQTLATLHRMVPMRSMRRGARVALLKRPAFSDALALLDALAGALGGEFAAAHQGWTQQVETHGVAEPAGVAEAVAAADEDAGEPGADGTERKRRRRGRRGGRGRRRPGGAARPAGTDGSEPAPESRPAPSASPGRPQRQPRAAREPRPAAPGMPPVWDDNYFFAALPSVPAIEAEERDTDRYGALSVGSAARAEQEPDDPAEAATGDGSSGKRRRRRRGGRRHKKGGPILPPGGAPASADEEAS